MERPLLVLNLDGLLCSILHNAPIDCDTPHTFKIKSCKTKVLLRPGLFDFLRMVGEYYQIAIWSDGNREPILETVEAIWAMAAKQKVKLPVLKFTLWRIKSYNEKFLTELNYCKEVGVDRVVLVDTDRIWLKTDTRNLLMAGVFYPGSTDQKADIELKVIGEWLVKHRDTPSFSDFPNSGAEIGPGPVEPGLRLNRSIKPNQKPLLVLDLDETLVCVNSEIPENFTGPPDHELMTNNKKQYVYFRPGLLKALEFLSRWYSFAVWTAGKAQYAQDLTKLIFSGFPIEGQPKFVFSWDQISNPDGRFYKDLRDVAILGYDLKKVVLIDDSDYNTSRNPKNSIKISQWNTWSADQSRTLELMEIAVYLYHNRETEDFQTLDLIGWATKK